MKELQVLISCMSEDPIALVKKMNLQNQKCIVINQVDVQQKLTNGDLKVFNTTERGLSKSRNMAIKQASEKYCLIADDDEYFVDELNDVILKAYESVDADIILFDINNFGYKNRKIKKIGFFQILKACSVQITFDLEKLKKKHITFDENLGSGSFYGSGEETLFLLNCLKEKMKVVYVPVKIADLDEKSESQWFKGFDYNFFYKRGLVTYYIFKQLAYIYAVYFLLRKYRVYKNDISFKGAAKSLYKGMKDCRKGEK